MIGRWCSGLLASACAAAGVMLAPVAWAQPPGGSPAGSAPPPSSPRAEPGAADASGAPEPAAEVQLLKSALERQEERLQSALTAAAEARRVAEQAREAASSAQKAAEDAAMTSSGDEKREVLRIYGFTEAGFERSWADETNGTGVIQPAVNASSFVVGNLDFYFDAQPLRDWRSLVEVRFSNAPLGTVLSYGGLVGTFSRVNTRQTDPNAASAVAPQWAGSVIIERAQIDWTPTELLKLRAGDFFTPFGIWNVDHGAPTLIPIALPLSIANQIIPLRQIGLMAYGNTFAGPWELGYLATISNGRQELSTFAFDDNRGYGGRLYASKDSGDLVLKFGLSGYVGKTRDKEIDLVGFVPQATFANHSNFRYDEWDIGADVSLDIHRTRIRAEGIVHRVQYDTGQHEPSPFDPTVQLPNRYESSVYAVVAQQLPWFGLEPYVMAEAGYLPFPIPGVDTAFTPSVGLNVRFSPSVLFKAQVLRTLFYGTRTGTKVPGIDAAQDDVTGFFSRLVLVF